jgi:adenylyltransferase/sulfurtransferase
MNFIKNIIPDGKEEICYCLGYKVGNKRIVKYVLKPNVEEMIRSETYVRTNAYFDCRLYNAIENEGTPLIVQIHWHKFADTAWFSSVDDRGARSLHENAKKFHLAPEVMQIVFTGSEKFLARVYKEGGFHYYDALEIVGSDGINLIGESSNPINGITSMQEDIFVKNVLAFSETGAEKIKRAKILLAGAGGIGSALLYQLIRVGFSDITIVDHDVIEASNCNRLYFIENPRAVIGRSKVKYLKKAVKKFNKKARIAAYQKEIRPDDKEFIKILQDRDIVILALDNDRTRAVINNLAARYAKPLINFATQIYMDESGYRIKNAAAQMQTFLPREEGYPCLECCGSLKRSEIENGLMDTRLKEMRAKQGYIANTPISPTPQVIPLNSLIVSIGCWEIASWISGIKPIEKWIYFDAMRNEILNLSPQAKKDCSCCGTNEGSILATGDYQPDLSMLIASPEQHEIKSSIIEYV